MATVPDNSPSLAALAAALRSDATVFTDDERALLAGLLRHASRSGPRASAKDSDLTARISAAVGEAIARRLLQSGSQISAPDSSASPWLAGPGPHPGGRGGNVEEDVVRGPGPHPGPSPNIGGPGPHPGPSPNRGGPGPKHGPGPKRHHGRHSGRHHKKGPGPHPGPSPNIGGPGPHPGPSPNRGGPGPKRRKGPGPHPRRGRRRRIGYRAEAALPGNGSVVVLDEFLAPQELQRLQRFVSDRESDFVLSEVVAPGATATAVDFQHRKSRVLFDLGEHEAVVSGRILSYLPRILPAVGLDPFPIASVEAQITASNDGDFFHPHEDNGAPPLETRQLTFVYFFHREPRPFRGGELRIYQPASSGNGHSGRPFRAIVPRQNQLVVFPSHLLHEITPVACRSRAFRDSRFTLNGWFHRPE